MTTRRVLLAIAALALLSVIGVAVVLATLDQRALTERVALRVLSEISERLGRDITAEGARGTLLPNPRVTLFHVAVEGRRGEPPLMEADEVHVHLRLWPLVRSFGREIEVAEISAESPELHLIRDEEGRWNFEHLGGDDDRGREREITIGRVSMTRATVQLIDRRGPRAERAVSLSQLDLTLTTAALDEPSTLRASAALASETPNLDVDVSLDPVDETDAVERWPRARGTIAVRGADLAQLRGLLPAGLGSVLQSGRVDLEGELDTREDGHYQLAGEARLANARLRGRAARGRAMLVAHLDPADPTTLHAQLQRLRIAGPGLDLSGTASFTREPRCVTFALAGPLLDLDALVSPSGEPQAGPRASVVTPSMQRALSEIVATGTLRVDRVVRGRLELRDLVSRARMRRGVLVLDDAEARLHGGRVIASGTEVDLSRPTPTWTLRARLERVDVGPLMQQITQSAPLRGRLAATLHVDGAGARWEEVVRNAAGTGALTLSDGALTSANLGARVLGVAAEALRAVGRDVDVARHLESGRTELRDATMNFRVQDGALVLTQPLAVDTAFGAVRLDGRVGLDRSLDLSGTAIVAPETLASITRARGGPPLEVPLRIRGTLSRPEIALPPPAELAARIAEPFVRERARRLEDRIQQRAREQLGDVLRGRGIAGIGAPR